MTLSAWTFAVIQGLDQSLQERGAKIEEQQREIEDVRSELDALKRAVAELMTGAVVAMRVTQRAVTPSQARFYLLFTDQPTGFDLMAECSSYGVKLLLSSPSHYRES